MALEEIKGYGNVAYLLDDDLSFKLNDYKIIKQDENKDSFVTCYQTKQNGKKKLLYLSGEYESLAQLLPMLPSEKIVMLLADLIKTVIKIKNQGHLVCERICLGADKIFVDKAKWTVKVIYFPVQVDGEGSSNFDNIFASEIIKLIDISNNLKEEHASKIRSIMSNGMISLAEKQQAVASLINGQVELTPRPNPTPTPIFDDDSEDTLPIVRQPKLIFFATNGIDDVRFEVTKPEFVIGRNSQVVDGHIGISTAIGRTHCKIVFENNRYFLVDLNSSNGTFINDKRLAPNERTPLNSGDIVRLAKSVFKVKY